MITSRRSLEIGKEFGDPQADFYRAAKSWRCFLFVAIDRATRQVMDCSTESGGDPVRDFIRLYRPRTAAKARMKTALTWIEPTP